MEWWVLILWSEWLSWRLLLMRNVFLVFTMRTQSRFSTISMFWHVLHCKFMGISMFGWGKCLRLAFSSSVGAVVWTMFQSYWSCFEFDPGGKEAWLRVVGGPLLPPRGMEAGRGVGVRVAFLAHAYLCSRLE